MMPGQYHSTPDRMNGARSSIRDPDSYCGAMLVPDGTLWRDASGREIVRGQS